MFVTGAQPVMEQRNANAATCTPIAAISKAIAPTYTHLFRTSVLPISAVTTKK